MVNNIRVNHQASLPDAVKAKLGIGQSRIKVIRRQDGEIIARATQDIGEVTIRLTQVKGERAKSIELTERELHKILLMARDIRRMTGQDDQDQDDLCFSLD